MKKKKNNLDWIVFLATSIQNNKGYETQFSIKKKNIIEAAEARNISILVEDVSTLCHSVGMDRNKASPHEVIRLCVKFLSSSILSFFVVGEKKISEGIKKEIELCHSIGVPVVYFDDFLKNILKVGKK